MSHRRRLVAVLAAVIAVAMGVASAPALQTPPPATAPSLPTRPSTGPSTKPATRAARAPDPARERRFTAATQQTWAPTTRPAFVESREVVPPPASIDELRSMQRQVQDVVARVTPTVVGLQVGGGQGSGVIVSVDGYVLTAGHVSGEPGQAVVITFPDGSTKRGISLGANYRVDSGLIKITDKGPYPFAEMADSSALKLGQFTIAIGHPGGYQEGRRPVVRVGRIVNQNNTTLTTDNSLVGGDSGGPLFDMQGRVVGIHSRIAPDVANNMHVPSNQFANEWKLLASGQTSGMSMAAATARPMLGIRSDNSTDNQKPGVVIRSLDPMGAADRAGLKEGDIITKFDSVDIKGYTELSAAMGQVKFGQTVRLEVIRAATGNKETVSVVFGIRRRP